VGRNISAVWKKGRTEEKSRRASGEKDQKISGKKKGNEKAGSV